MNAPVLLAQLSGSTQTSSPEPKTLKIEKPTNGQALSFHLDGNTRLDLSDIASEKLTFVKVGEKLIVLFDNQSTVTVDPVFDSATGDPLSDVGFQVGADRVLSGDQFAALFPISTDQSILPAAGNSGPTGGADFHDAQVGALGPGGTPLGLLGDETFGNQQFGAEDTGFAGITFGTATVGQLDDEGLIDGLIGGAGDEPGSATSVTGNLNIDFGSVGVSGASLAFATTQAALSGLTSGGETIHLQISNPAGGTPTIIGYVGDDPTAAGSHVFEISLDLSTSTGQYTFTLLRPLDHPGANTEDTLNLVIEYSASNASGTFASTFGVHVNDDSPALDPNGFDHSLQVNGSEGSEGSEGQQQFAPHEDVKDPDGGTSERAGTLGILWGADHFNAHENGGVSETTGQAGDRSLIFTDANVGLSSGETSLTNNLFSHGEQVHFALEQNGTRLVAFTGEGSEDEGANIVFTVDLTDTGSGGYTFIQNQELDHIGASGEQQQIDLNSLDLTFHYTATDSDGDSVVGSFKVTVNDDAPTIDVEGVEDGQVAEDAFNNGNPGDTYNNTQGTESLSFSGDLGVSWGADDSNSGSANRSLAFDGVSEGGAVKDHDGSSVTSHDQAVHYHLTTVGDQALLVGYTGNAAAEDQSNWVFTVQLHDNSNTGSYTFTLLKPIDHPTENSEDNITLDFGFTATDADGDHDSSSFSVSINDDAPVPSDTVETRTVDEGDISTWWSAGSSPNDGASDGSDTGGPLASFLSGLFGITVGGPAYISGSVAATVAFGADGAHTGGGFGFATDSIATMEGLGLTSKGGTVHYALIGDTLVGYVNNNANPSYQFWSDRPVLALTLHSDGSYEFRQFDQLDHVDNDSDPHNFALKTSSDSIDTLDFGALITATDGDGDSISLAGKFTIAIQDDIPVVTIAANGMVTIDETGGHQNGNDDNTTSSSARHLFDSVAGYAGSDPDMTGPIYARDNLVSTTTTTGADDPAAKTLSLQIAVQDSGLTTTDGHHIYLYQVSDTLVVGRVDGEDGAAAFAVAIEQSGKVSVVQYMSLHHGDDQSSNESIDLTGKLSAVVTVTDHDGDTVIQTTNIGDNIKFLDDGPKLAGTVEARTVDEGDIATWWSAGSSPNDGASDGSDTGGPLASFLSGLFGFPVGGPAYISGSVAATVAFGADGAHAGGGFGFATDAMATMESLGLTSKGGTVHYAMVGDTLVGYVQQTFFDRPVMALTLHSDGSYEFRQFDQLDHVSGGEHNLALDTGSGTSIPAIDFGALITATDGDGDSVSLEGKFTIAIQDDTPVQIAGRTVSGVVEEEQLSGGNEDKSSEPLYLGFIDTTTNEATGNLRSLVSAGADEVTGTRGTFFLGDTSGLPSITSQGKPVAYVVTDGSDSGSLGDKLTAYVDLDGDHQFSTGDRVVFTLTLENNGTTSGNYVFTLLSPIDHIGSGEDTRTLDLSSVIRFSDYDGDTITLSSGSFKIDVIDDIPTVASNAAVVVDDDDVGTHGNPGGTGDQNPAHAMGTLAHSYGADRAGTVKLLESGAPGGFDYHVDSTGTILTISQTVGPVTTDVIQITLSDDTSGNYAVEQLAPIHHVSGGNENNQPFTVSYHVTDKDGDTAATNGTLSITVNDDTPAPVVVVNTVSENGTATLIEDETVGVQSGGPDADSPSDVKPEQDVDHLPSIFAGLTVLAAAGAGIGFAERAGAVTLTPHYGADGQGEHHLHLTGASGGTLNGVATNIFDTATGHRVFLYTDSTSGIVVGRLGSDDQANHPNPDGDIVFAIGLSDDGALSLAQYRAIQHPNSGDRDEAVTLHNSGSTNDAIFVTATVTDSDNDSVTTSPQALVIRFDDDAPVIDMPAAGANLIVNGQFTDDGGFGAPMSWGGQAAPADSDIEGWHIANNNLERNPANWFVSDPANGGHVVDLDATPGNVTLSQTFGNLTDGESYTLTFDAAKPSGYDAKLEVYWNGNPVGTTITPSGDHFEQFSITVTAGSGTNTLEFREVGTADNGGTFLANVAMHATTSIVNEDALGGNAGGQGDAGTGASAVGSLGIHWGADSSDVADAGGVQDGATSNSVSDNIAALSGRSVYFTDSDSISSGLQPMVAAFASAAAITLHAAGQEVHYQVLENGTKLVGYTGTFDVTDTTNWVFTVSLSDEGTGKYSFNLLKPIDHPMSGSEDDINLVFGFTARDADGDTTSSTLTITVDDDTPVITAPVTANVLENGSVSELDNGSFESAVLASGALGVITDERGNYTYNAPSGWTISGGNGGAFAPANNIVDASGHDGSNVVWLRSGAMLAQTTGTTLHAGDIYGLHFNLGDRTDQSFPGGEVRLIATNGIDSFELASLDLPTPTDGTWTTVDLSTGQIPDSYNGYQLRVEIQQGDGTGNQILIDDVEVSHFVPSVAEDSLNINWGADNDAGLRIVAFDGTPNASGLSSGGQPIHYEMTGSTLLKGVSADGRMVFTLELSNSDHGSYKFTLLSNLDHEGANGAVLPLDFAYKVIDADGDTTFGNIHVNVNDQDLSLSSVSDSSVDEVTVNSPYSNAFVPQTIVEHTLGIQWGADNANPGAANIDRSVVLTTATAPADLHSNGFALEYVLSADGTILTAYRIGMGTNPVTHEAEKHYFTESGGDLLRTLTDYAVQHARVFSVTLSDNGTGSYSFTLYGNLDHNGANDTMIPLKFGFSATDADGDIDTGDFTINVQDSIPLPTTPADSTVTESGVETIAHTVSGAIGIDWNGDIGAAKHLAFVGTPADLNLKSQGQNLAYDIVADGDNQMLIAYRDNDTTHAPVFTVQFTEANPYYTFTLLQPLDHDPASDSLTIPFTVKATDSDGDVAMQTFNVTVDDSHPSASDIVVAITENQTIQVDLTDHNLTGHVDFGADGPNATGSLTLGTVSVTNGPAGVTLGHPSVALGADGHTVTVDPGSAFDALQEGQTATLHIPYTAKDGDGDTVTKEILVTVTGTNDAASISGLATGSVTEDGTLTASGTLSVSDADNGESHFQTPGSLAGIHGTFMFDADTGAWGYTLNNSDADVQALNDGESLHDALTVSSLDGTATETIDVTIHGANDSVPPPSVAEAAIAAHYAFWNDALSPNTISFDAKTLFTGSNLNYTVTELLNPHGNSVNWDWFHSDNSTTFSGNPNINGDVQRGLYVARVEASNDGGDETTYVAFSVLGKNGGSNQDGSRFDVIDNSHRTVTDDWRDNLVVLKSGENISGDVSGGSNHDVVIGNEFANRLFGSDGNDAIYGGAGDDYIDGGSNTDFLSGDAGNDTIYGRDGDDFLLGGAGDDYLYGESNNDTLVGGTGDDHLYGSDGNDRLEGGAGADHLDGGENNDILIGGLGHDTLTGGGVNTKDIFVFAENGPDNYDTILDYDGNSSNADRLDLSALLDANFVNGTSNQSDFVKLVNSGNDVKVQVDTDGTGTGAGWTDVAVFQGYHQSGNHVLVEFESQVRTMTVTA